MHRIDANGHVANQFSMGDPTIGAPATQVDADWCNAVQESICQFLEYMGIALTKGDHTQLRKAVMALLDRANAWSAPQTLQSTLTLSGPATILRLIAGAAQAISKTGGVLQVGTGDSHDLELFRNLTVMLALTDAGIDFKNVVARNISQMIMSSVTVDPGGAPAGALWFRSDLGKFRAMQDIARTLATEDWVNSTPGSPYSGNGTLMRRNGVGRAEVEDPAGGPDVANARWTQAQDAATLAAAKSYSDGLESLTDGSGGVSPAANWTLNTARCLKSRSGMVVLSLAVTAGASAGVTICTLPAGFRPVDREYPVGQDLTGSPVALAIQASGAVTMTGAVSGHSYAVSCVFRQGS